MSAEAWRKSVPPLYWWRLHCGAFDERTGAWCEIKDVRDKSDRWIWAISVAGKVVAKGIRKGELAARASVRKALSKLPEAPR